MELRVEVFVSDLDRFVDFYRRVIDFELESRSDSYAAVRRDGVRIGASVAWTDVDASARAVPVGVEIVLEVDDLQREHERVLAAGWTLEGPIREQPWGLSDFRIFDPDGYYLRLSTKQH